MIKSTSIILVISGFLFLASCNDKGESPSNDYAESGIILSKNAIKLVDDLSVNISSQSYSSEFIKIMNDPSPETYVMKGSKENQYLKYQFLYLSNALKSFEKVYTAYQLQLDSKISTSNSNLGEKLTMACNALDSIELSDILKTKNNTLKKNLSSGKFRIEGSIFQITDIYCEIWDEISKKYLASQLNFQQEYQNGIKQIPVTAFNPEQIKTKITEPYSNNAVLVNLYKLNLIKEYQEKQGLLEKKINSVSEAFILLIQIQGELIKRNQDRVKVQELSSALEVSLANQ